MRAGSLVLLFAMMVGPVAAQSGAPVSVPVHADRLVRQVHVDTNDPSALVYADSTFLGRAAESPFVVSPTASRIRVLTSAVDAWSRPPIEYTLAGASGNEVRVPAFFRYRYRIESAPSAQVELDGSIVGRTPVTAEFERPVNAAFTLRREGYMSALVEPDSALWNRHFVTLTRLADAPEDVLDVSMHDVRRGNRWIDVAATGLAVTGGLVAVHYKLKADRRFEAYEESGDPTLRPGIKRMDTVSGFGLGAMQVGLGVLAFRLVIR